VSFERAGTDSAVVVQLRALGHAAKFAGAQGDGNTIIVKNGVAYGANDRRSSDSKASAP
jgi:gamma-glutamyltranspeptidase